MHISKQDMNLISILKGPFDAAALISGSPEYPNIIGKARFYQLSKGVMVVTEAMGLPSSVENCGQGIFAFHIHSGENCSGTESDPFSDALTHYNPHESPHPCHAGDLPPLFGNKGYAFSAVFTDRFSVKEIIGKTLIIHSSPDDFTTQPSGNSGNKIACGKIVSMR